MSLVPTNMRPTNGATPEARSGHENDQALRVLVVDDHPAVRVGLRELIAAEPDLTPVAAVATASEGFAQAIALAPGIAIVDHRLPDDDGLTLTRRLKSLPDPPGVLVYSAYADPTLVIGAIVAGADGIVGKTARGDQICDAVRAIAAGDSALPEVSPAALRAIAGRLDPADTAILGMLVHRASPREVAEVLAISDDWLDARRWAILQQLTGRDGP
jgi:DNA-binding NarL/FixJ family response regulator